MSAKLVIFAGQISKRMKRIVIMMAMALMLASCNQDFEKSITDFVNELFGDGSSKNKDTKNKKDMEKLNGNEPVFDIVTTYGTMRVRLYNKTPQHRDNFVKLVSEKYYDGIRFHRVIDGFMIQAGDPYSRNISEMDKWGTGGPAYTIPAEFQSEYTHKRGALAAARKGDIANPRKASSGSQFYIVQDEEACTHLDGQYTVFGEVVSGLEVIDAIAAAATDRYYRPYEDVIITAINPVTEQATAEEISAPADSTKTE